MLVCSGYNYQRLHKFPTPYINYHKSKEKSTRKLVEIRSCNHYISIRNKLVLIHRLIIWRINDLNKSVDPIKPIIIYKDFMNIEKSSELTPASKEMYKVR